MSDKPTTRGEIAVTAYLDGLTARGELIAGAREYLAKRFASSNKHGGIDRLAGFLESPEGARYRNSERDDPGHRESPLRRICRRFDPILATKESADELHDYLAMRIDPADAEKRPGQVARRIFDLLETPEHRRRVHEKYRAGLPHRQQRVMAALDSLGRYLPRAFDRETYAQKWRDIGESNDQAEVIRVVARRLAAQGLAEVPPEEVGSAVRSLPDAPEPSDLRAEFAKLGGYEPF